MNLRSPQYFEEAVLVRPKMYTSNGTFGEIMAFLEGYFSGHSNNHLKVEARRWSEFKALIAKNSNPIEANRHVDTYPQKFATDTEALATFCKDYQDFVVAIESSLEDKEVTAQGLKHVDFIESVLLRPKMYTTNGTFGELIAFINGYFSDHSKNHPLVGDDRWPEFLNWLKDKFGLPRSDNRLTAYPQNFTSDAEAVAAFYKSYLDFIAVNESIPEDD